MDYLKWMGSIPFNYAWSELWLLRWELSGRANLPDGSNHSTTVSSGTLLPLCHGATAQTAMTFSTIGQHSSEACQRPDCRVKIGFRLITPFGVSHRSGVLLQIGRFRRCGHLIRVINQNWPCGQLDSLTPTPEVSNCWCRLRVSTNSTRTEMSEIHTQPASCPADQAPLLTGTQSENNRHFTTEH